jgi:hypothetical protein
MNVEPIQCSQCGAPLQVPEDVNFVTCGHCHAPLQIRRDASVTYTQLVKELDRRTAEMSEQLAKLRQGQKLEDIDRQWQIERESYMLRGKHGSRMTPTVAGGVITMIVGGGFGLFWTFMATTITRGAPGGVGSFFPLFGILFTVLVIGGGIYAISKAKRLEEAERDYRRRRAAAQHRADD